MFVKNKFYVVSKYFSLLYNLISILLFFIQTITIILVDRLLVDIFWWTCSSWICLLHKIESTINVLLVLKNLKYINKYVDIDCIFVHILTFI